MSLERFSHKAVTKIEMVTSKVSLSILSTLLLCSCYSVKNTIQHNGFIEITTSNMGLINGKYQVNSALNGDSVISNLYWDIFDRGYNKKDSIEYIQLKILNNKKISVTHLDGDFITRSKVFKGKLSEGYFQFKTKRFVVPGIFVNVYRTRDLRIGLNENKNLIADYHEISLGTTFFIFPFYEKKQESNVEFKRN